MEIAQIAVLVALAWMIIALVSNKVPFGAIGLGIPFNPYYRRRLRKPDQGNG